MPFITQEDRELHRHSQLPPYPPVNPAAYESTEAYLKAVGQLMANHARLAFRRGHSPSCQMWVYAPELSDQTIRQVLADAINAYAGENIAILAVHTSSMSQEQTGVNLALKI